MDTNQTNVQAPENEIEMIPETPIDKKDIEKRVKKSYNAAGAALLIQLGVATMITSAISGILSFIFTLDVMLNQGIEDPVLVIEMVTEKLTAPLIMLAMTVVSYLAANLFAYFIGNAFTKKNYNAKLFGKIQMKPLDCILAVLAVLGIQMVSVLIQTLVINLTGMNGVDETTASLLSFSDNILQNVLMVVYTVIIAAITEELLCRGVVMKSLSPVSPSFALVASSALFGIMHGNFNQMFNGFLLGLVIGYAAIKSKSIFLPIILHMAANGHAMVMGFLEYKLGKSFLPIETVYIIVLAAVGVAAAVLLYVRCGKPNETDGYPCTTKLEGIDGLEDKSGLTWKALFKTPCFWIFTAVYFATAVMMMTPIA